jgi:hypothetical protein
MHVRFDEVKKIKPLIAEYLARIGRRGGSKSRRKLSVKDARGMAVRRWAKQKKDKK